VLGHSRLSGPDVLGGPNAYKHIDAIIAIIRPGLNWKQLDGNTQRDVMHLAIHHANAWDLFVTTDTGISNYAKPLADELGIFVASPEDASVRIRSWLLDDKCASKLD
jgi:hypothetical protein